MSISGEVATKNPLSTYRRKNTQPTVQPLRLNHDELKNIIGVEAADRIPHSLPVTPTEPLPACQS
ncbi:MAG: hypothetical protein ACR2N1_17200 [Rubripirellula sp.]